MTPYSKQSFLDLFFIYHYKTKYSVKYCTISAQQKAVIMIITIHKPEGDFLSISLWVWNIKLPSIISDSY